MCEVFITALFTTTSSIQYEINYVNNYFLKIIKKTAINFTSTLFFISLKKQIITSRNNQVATLIIGCCQWVATKVPIGCHLK